MDQAASLSLTVADITNAAVADPATQAVVDAGDQATKNGGFFGPIAGLFEGILKVQLPVLITFPDALALSQCKFHSRRCQMKTNWFDDAKPDTSNRAFRLSLSE